MNNRFSPSLFSRITVFSLFFAMLLSACNSGSKTQTSAPVASVTSTSAITLQGQIRDDDGYFTTGSLAATDFKGKEAARTEWQDDDGRYTIEIPSGTGFPLLLTARSKHEGKKSQILLAVVLSPTLTKHDITPNSTKVARKAKSLGGYTAQNLMQATLDTVNRPQGDRSVEGFRGDPTKQFGGWH